jgi:hypothetical protein
VLKTGVLVLLTVVRDEFHRLRQKDVCYYGLAVRVVQDDVFLADDESFLDDVGDDQEPDDVLVHACDVEQDESLYKNICS